MYPKLKPLSVDFEDEREAVFISKWGVLETSLRSAFEFCIISATCASGCSVSNYRDVSSPRHSPLVLRWHQSRSTFGRVTVPSMSSRTKLWNCLNPLLFGMVDLLSAIREHQGGRRQKVGLVRLNSQHRISPFPFQWAARPLAAERLLVVKVFERWKNEKNTNTVFTMFKSPENYSFGNTLTFGIAWINRTRLVGLHRVRVRKSKKLSRYFPDTPTCFFL